MNDEDQPKYLNSPETPIYKKTSVLYNLHRARDGVRRSGRVVLVEGYMDVIGVYAAGVKEVVASCGTALTNGQVRTMHRHADTVVVNFDPDTAGANAAEKAIQLAAGRRACMCAWWRSMAGSIRTNTCKQNGAEAYRAKLDGAATYFHWLADRARAQFDMKTSDGKWPRSSFCCRRCRRSATSWSARPWSTIWRRIWAWIRAWCWINSRKRRPSRRAPAPQAAPASGIPHMERILLNALLSSDRARAEMLPALLPELTDELRNPRNFRGVCGRPAEAGADVFVFRSGGPFTGPREGAIA